MAATVRRDLPLAGHLRGPQRPGSGPSVPTPPCELCGLGETAAPGLRAFLGLWGSAVLSPVTSFGNKGRCEEAGQSPWREPGSGRSSWMGTTDQSEIRIRAQSVTGVKVWSVARTRVQSGEARIRVGLGAWPRLRRRAVRVRGQRGPVSASLCGTRAQSTATERRGAQPVFALPGPRASGCRARPSP